MLISIDSLKGYKLDASDGPIGSVADFLFDQAHWTVRWMVANSGKWLRKHQVLISPIMMDEPDWSKRLLPVRMTKEEIEGAPDLSSDAPVSREYEISWFDHYGWPYYWGGPDVWGGVAAPGEVFVPRPTMPGSEIEGSPEAGEHALRSTNEICGYHIQASDGAIGHVDDFIMDDKAWTLRYMVVSTRAWLPGRKVLIAPTWVDSIEWSEQMVVVNMTREAIKDSPPYDPMAPVNRVYEEELHDYYGRPVYWEE